ncbi:hypothetical protein [Sphingobacterium sp. LRF_L2]|uniref:hypothetical protein n=1 Tax=Sphingobacterium sp. LRF_L2 TaxID=3369421 RepID=UPI003F5FF1AA
MKKKEKTLSTKPTFERPVDRYFYEMDDQFQGNKWIYGAFLTLMFFGVLGLVWMIPFPKLGWLERMNMHTFLNWGSFYIAIMIYLYLKLAPTLSYAMLFSIGIMSFFIVQLEYLEKASGPAVWLIALVVALLGGIGLYVTLAKESKSLSIQTYLRFLTLGPVWLWSKVFLSLKIKY